MSRAFVKEDAEGRWTAPAALHEYRVLIEGEVVRETDDLLDALNWMQGRPARGFELRSRDGQLLAVA
ncbi:hypothetical protein ACFOPQ_08315 [Deinococcus antarcticus]|uniref:Uncharacterized protein n=1 Tax=Deinococcus antarcticus TaxID=1298767 RepID=A0ABV8A5X2_9DEIO